MVSEKLAISLNAIVWFVLGVLFLLALPPLLMLPWWLVGVAAAVGLLVALLPYAVSRRRARRSIYGQPPSYLRCATASLLVVGILAGLPVYYLSYQVTANPVVMPTVTLSNGDRTVVLQGMQHVGAEGFYKAVVYDLENALAEGYRLYYEGVQPATPESDRWFADNLAGGSDLSANYRSLAEACGMTFQLDYFAPLAHDMAQHPERHVTADVTTLAMQQEYERLRAADPAFAAAIAGKADGARQQSRQLNELMTGIVNWQQTADEGQRFLAGIVCRGFFNVALGMDADPGPLDPVVIDFRNRYLVQQLLADPAPRIYVTYGGRHLPGVLALLKEQDPRWEVQSVKWLRAMAMPEHFEGTLLLP